MEGGGARRQARTCCGCSKFVRIEQLATHGVPQRDINLRLSEHAVSSWAVALLNLLSHSGFAQGDDAGAEAARPKSAEEAQALKVLQNVARHVSPEDEAPLAGG